MYEPFQLEAQAAWTVHEAAERERRPEVADEQWRPTVHARSSTQTPVVVRHRGCGRIRHGNARVEEVTMHKGGSSRLCQQGGASRSGAGCTPGVQFGHGGHASRVRAHGHRPRARRVVTRKDRGSTTHRSAGASQELWSRSKCWRAWTCRCADVGKVTALVGDNGAEQVRP